MKRIAVSIFLFVFIGLLSGCISIPIGDNVLEISADGIQITDNSGDDDEAEDEGDAEAGIEEEEEDSSEAEGIDEEEEMEGEDEEADNVAGATGGSSGAGIQAAAGQQCERQDHSDITQYLDVAFPFPDCAVVNRVRKQEAYVQAELDIEADNWERILQEYKTILADYLASENKNNARESVDLKVKYPQGSEASLTIRQAKEDVKLSLTYYFGN